MSTMTAPQLERTRRTRSAAMVWTLVVLGGLAVVSTVRTVTGAHEITSRGSLDAAVLATCPILLAALGGLWSERAGVINIGLEGQMILGTWGAAYFTYWYSPVHGIVGAALMGALGGVIHAVATVTFGVDHIISGVAVNLIGLGLAAFLAEAFFKDLSSERGTGGPEKLQGIASPPEWTLPWVSDVLGDLSAERWFLVSDVAGLGAALTTNLSLMTVLTAALVGLTAWLLWHTRFGLRLRSCGENPQAAESLGIHVLRYKYAAVTVSGALAGLGGGYLALVASSGYSADQTNGRGFIGLAAMIFGNWRPGGILAGAGMFGYADSLRLRDPSTVHALLLLVAVVLFAAACYRAWRGSVRQAIVLGVAGALFLAWFALTEEVPRDFTSMTPYVGTLLVLGFAAQRLRMPAANGQVYRKGSAG